MEKLNKDRDAFPHNDACVTGLTKKELVAAIILSGLATDRELILKREVALALAMAEELLSPHAVVNQ